MPDTVSLRRRIFLILERSERSDRLGKAVDVALIVLIGINVVAVILETVEPIYQEHQTVFSIVDHVSVVVFSVEYVMRLWCAPENENFRRAQFPRLSYAVSPMAIIDLLAILPFYLAFLIPIDLRFLRVLRLLRVLKLTRYSSAMSMLLNVFRQEGHAFLAAASILSVLLVIAASGAYLVEHKVQPEDFGSIPAAMWWAVVTLTTVGYGDTSPITNAGKFFGGMVAIVGIGMAALPAGIIASGLAAQLRRNREMLVDQLRHALEDGVIDADEEAELEEMRKDLGLSRTEFEIALKDERERRKHHHHGRALACPHCGKAIRLDQG